MNQSVIDELYAILEDRKQADPSTSYTAGLYAAGLPRIARKVMEEAYETVEAAQFRNPEITDRSENLIHEIADLWFHTLVLACQQNLKLEDIYQELAGRMGRSGYEEKNSRETE